MKDSQIISKIQGYRLRNKIFNFIRMAILMVTGFLFIKTFMYDFIKGNFKGAQLVWIVVGVIIAIIFAKLSTVTEKQLKNFIGETITKPILEKAFEIETYKPTGYMDENELTKSKVLPSYTKIKGSDYVKGKYRGKDIEFCDLTLIYEDKDDDRKREETVFKGKFMKIKLDKPVEKGIQLCERTEKKRAKGFLGEKFGSFMGMLDGYNEIETESVDFNERFVIKTQDPHTAFYVLTPNFMESILTLDNTVKARTNMCFQGDYMYLSVYNNVDSFEIGKNINKKLLGQVRVNMNANCNFIFLF